MIPQIMQYHITTRVVNTLRNYLQEDDYFFTENKFILKHLKIGPFVKNKEYTVKIASLINKNIQFPHSHFHIVHENTDKNTQYEMPDHLYYFHILPILPDDQIPFSFQ